MYVQYVLLLENKIRQKKTKKKQNKVKTKKRAKQKTTAGTSIYVQKTRETANQNSKLDEKVKSSQVKSSQNKHTTQ